MAKILILDDIPEAVEAIKKILSRKGHELFGFTDEDEALAFASGRELDLAILDIKLNKMSGVDVLDKLKKTNPTIKVIMLTGYPGLDTASKSIERGADEYCVKPIDKDELELKVSMVLKGAQPF